MDTSANVDPGADANADVAARRDTEADPHLYAHSEAYFHAYSYEETYSNPCADTDGAIVEETRGSSGDRQWPFGWISSGCGHVVWTYG